ncbi:MAG: arsenate reductase ArsC [Clostridia bacterium]|nr:arsenate reductase ArsC [Clostridia bacterium]
MKLKVAFVCTGNSCRSQMAEGYTKHLGSDVLEVYSAGTHPTTAVNPNAVEVMKEAGIDLGSHYPKMLEDIPNELDILITMGCGVVCPFVPNKHEEDWGLEDPVGKPIEEFRKTRDTIKEKVESLIQKVKEGTLS